ncbi:MAG: AMP-binding protein [Chloroflexi bacterium]|nr:AMP-binding protein [Chloroflexota bacterium]
MTIDTMPKMLRENAERFGNLVALREKRFGIWQSYTWNEYLERVRNFALGLHQLGFGRGDFVGIVGDNRPEWVITELAAQSLGGASMGIYQDSTPEEVHYLISQAVLKFLVVEDQEQIDKIVELWDQIQGIEKVFYYDPKGLRHYDEDYLMAFPEVEAMGAQFHDENPGFYQAQVNEGKGSDVAILGTTSGTTSKPKVAMITHDNLVAMGQGLMGVDAFSEKDQFVSFLPLAWIGEQMISVACGMAAGFAVSFPEETETVQEDMREIGPRIIFAPPRIWESLLSTVQVKISDADRLKRWVYNRAIRYGYYLANKRFNKEEITLQERILEQIAKFFCYTNILDQLGLRYVKWAYTGGAALGPDVFRFFHALGVNLKQGYGQTETTGICVVHSDGDIKFQTVGLPMPGAEIKIDDSGEILARGRMCFPGYHANEEATQGTITEEGWVRTGDAGYFDEDGHLIVIDRAKDVMTLHDGTKFSPLFIENKLKFSPYIIEAVVFGGEELPFVASFINIDFGNVGKWAEDHQLAYTNYTNLAAKREVYDLIREDVARTNADLPPAARIHRFLLLHKELDADDAELTRTRKVRRNFIADNYREIIDGLYSDKSSIDIESVITYQDGRQATIQVTLPINTMGDEQEVVAERNRVLA